ncbi:hypothetical protein DY467_25595 [Rhodopseudomonas sp. BR0G17]|nr:hypothetical protein [Rhodopseudomonas sp. BR0G17]
METTLRSHKAEFRKMATYCINSLGPLANQKIANTEYHRRGLLLFTLCRHEPHSGLLGSFANRFGISDIILLPLYERFDVSRND